jgi:Trypsin
LGGCTAWLVSNGAVLTAGHCVDQDPDGFGPLPPDGVLDWNTNTVVGFNIPPSLSDGTPQPPDPNDQYPVDLTRVRWEHFGEGNTRGRDWAVFACLPNSTTHKTVQEVQNAFFRMTDLHPEEGASIKMTGYGVDNRPPGPRASCDADGDGNSNENCNAQSLTQQTSTGNYVEEDNDGSAIWHVYQVDTMPGNSGGPIIWQNNGLTIGIHTSSACADGPGNIGTSFERPPLELALQVFPGQNVNYVDKVTVNITQNGGIYRPFHFVTDAVNHIQTDLVPGIISIVAGSYNESLTINKRVTLVAPVGKVIIGQ